MVVRSLSPRLAPIRRDLQAVGLSQTEVDRVIADSYPPERVAAEIRKTARATLRLFERHGLYDEAQVREAFEAHRLLATDAAARPN